MTRQHSARDAPTSSESAPAVFRARVRVRVRNPSAAVFFHGLDEIPFCACRRERADAGNGARVRHHERECPLYRTGDGEGTRVAGPGRRSSRCPTAKGTIVWKTTNACGVVGFSRRKRPCPLLIVGRSWVVTSGRDPLQSAADGSAADFRELYLVGSRYAGELLVTDQERHSGRVQIGDLLDPSPVSANFYWAQRRSHPRGWSRR